jgi:hypothetical protein
MAFVDTSRSLHEGWMDQNRPSFACEAKVRLRRSIEEERRIVRARCFGSQFTLAKNNRVFN